MPYAVRRKGSRYQVVNTETGEIYAHSTSKAKAERQLHLLKGIERGWESEGDGRYKRTINGRTQHLKLEGKRSGKAK